MTSALRQKFHRRANVHIPFFTHREYIKLVFGQGETSYSIRNPLIQTITEDLFKPGVLKFQKKRTSVVHHVFKHKLFKDSKLPIIFPTSFKENYPMPGTGGIYSIDQDKGTNVIVDMYSSAQELKEVRSNRRAKIKSYTRRPKYTSKCPQPVNLEYNWEKMLLKIKFNFFPQRL